MKVEFHPSTASDVNEGETFYRRAFLVASGALLAPLAVGAQQAGKVYRIGYLSAPTRESVEHVLQAFLRRLRELGAGMRR